MKRGIVILHLALVLWLCAGCLTNGTGTDASIAEKLSETLEQAKTPVPTFTAPQTADQSPGQSPKETEKPLDAANEPTPAPSPLDEPLRYGSLTIESATSGEHSFSVRIVEMLWIGPEDTELIKQYGLPEELDGYDYEIVQKKDTEPFYLTADKNGGTSYEVLDWKQDIITAHHAEWSEFIEAVRACGESGMFVTFTANGSNACMIQEVYVP